MDYTEKDKKWESINYAKSVEAQNRYGFTIVFNGTDENVETHERFKQFAKAYDKVFISALRVLLDSYDKQREYECLLEQIDELEKRIFDLEQAGKEPVKEKKGPKTFGAGE